MIRAVLSLSQTAPLGVMKKQQRSKITDYLPTTDRLESYDTKELKQLFKYLHPSSNLNKYSRSFLLGNLSWHFQTIQEGSDPYLIRSRLINQFDQLKKKPLIQYLPGTRLIREWQGITHEVVIEENGFLWRKRHYLSLSRIAREITGTNWSGPRFFGLKS